MGMICKNNICIHPLGLSLNGISCLRRCPLLKMFQLSNISNQLSCFYEEFDEASQPGFALKCVITGFERATASEECKQLIWFSSHVVSDTCRLTLTDWLRLWETTKGCEPASVGMCDCICLSMRLCSDKSTDVCQIDRAFLSIKTVG